MLKEYRNLLLLLSFFIPSLTSAQDQIKELPDGYFMTVAAYLSSGEGYAQRYVNQLNQDGVSADYGFTYKKNMYFVYIKHYTDYGTAISEINTVRANTAFDDAWVYIYEAENRVIEPATPPAPVESSNTTATETTPNASEEDSSRQEITIPITTKDSVVTKPAEPVIDDGSRLIYFEALEARTQKPVDVEVTLFDPFSERVFSTMKSDETKRIKPPTNKEGIIRVKTNSFGWVGDAVNFNFADPITDSTEYFLRFRGDTLIVFFDMHRMRKGDVQTLYNVYFIPDASLVRPESKYELDELLGMLMENPTMKIALHGHTNGSSGGPYYRLSEGDTLYFSMNRKHERTSGSAKKLSYDRANTVKQYLVHNGIADERIEVKGWGGKKMIYDENSVASKRNIRVEVEVTEE